MASSNLINSSDVATFVLCTNAPYNILDFDQGLCVMTGYSPNELSKDICTLEGLIFTDDFADAIASINYQLSISNLINLQHRIKTKDDRILTVLCNGQAFTLNDGRDVLQCVFTDITHLENAANESAKAKTDLEIFASTVPSGLSKHLLDNKLSLLWANNYFYNMCGYTADEYEAVHGDNALSIIYTEDLAGVIDVLADLTEDSVSKISNFRIKCKDGSTKWVNAVLARAGEKKDGFPVLNLVLSDITDLKIAEMKARLEEQKYLIIADISEELPFEYEILQDVITFADKFSYTFEGSSVIANPAVNMIKSGLVSPDTKDAVEKLFAMADSGVNRMSAEFKLNTKDNGYQWYFSTCSTIYDEDLNPIRIVGLLRNIHDQKMEQQSLLAKAEKDLMTGLYNKITTENKIKTILNKLDGNTSGVLMLIDIDDFKKINDTYGHLKGDDVIVDIAVAMMEFSGDYGIPGRIGGDEFCLFLSNVLDIQLACEKADFIANKIRAKYPGENDGCKVTLSIGIAASNTPVSYSELLEHADTALYHAKLSGKNCHRCYTENMPHAKYENERTKTV